MPDVELAEIFRRIPKDEKRACLWALGVASKRPRGMTSGQTPTSTTAASGLCDRTITLAAGDLTQRADAQLATSPQICRRSCPTTVDQNIVLRWVPRGNSSTVQRAKAIGSEQAGAGTTSTFPAAPISLSLPPLKLAKLVYLKHPTYTPRRGQGEITERRGWYRAGPCQTNRL